MKFWPLTCIIIAVSSISLHAHEIRPAYLELRETGPDTFHVFWKVPAKGDMRLGLYLRLPGNCKPVTSVNSYYANDVFIERYTVVCPGGIDGQTIAINDLSATMTDVLVRLERAQVHCVQKKQKIFPLSSADENTGSR